MSEMALKEAEVLPAAQPANPVNLLQVAIQNKVDSQQLKELMDLEREWRADKAKAAYSEAMAKFNDLKRVIPHNKKGKTAGNAPFSYADFGQLVNAITPWLAQCGLSFSHSQDQPVMSQNGKIALIMVHCTVRHKDGHSEAYSCPAIPDLRLEEKVSPSQLLQLAKTYAKRQTLSEALGLATSDDAQDDDAVTPNVKPAELPLTPDQLKNLRTEMDKNGIDDAVMCEVASVGRVEDIVQGRLAGAINWVKSQGGAK